MKSLSRVGVGITFFLLQSMLPRIVSAQTASSIPAGLKPSLDARLASFVGAQKDGNWDLVASMLGRYRRGLAGDPLYTAEIKACVVRQMQAAPMTSFRIIGVTLSTKILPVHASTRWWYLSGRAVFAGKTQESSLSDVVAYRDNGEWYFTPPIDDDDWEKTQITEADLTTDHVDEVKIQVAHDSPLEVVDLHVFIDRTYPSLRNVKFGLRNRTTKMVKAFVITLGDEGGSSTLSTGQDIEPDGVFIATMTSSRYLYFCDGVNTDKLFVERVIFADGSEWLGPVAPPHSRSGPH
jgi:hypothetical protein